MARVTINEVPEFSRRRKSKALSGAPSPARSSGDRVSRSARLRVDSFITAASRPQASSRSWKNRSTWASVTWSPFQLISTGEDQDLNGVDHVGGVGGAGVELAQDAPGLELSAGPLAGGAESGVGGIDAPLVAGQRQVPAGIGVSAPGPARDTEPGPGALVALVRERGHPRLGEGLGKVVSAGGAHIVDGAGQGGRGPDQPAGGIGEDLHVHPVSVGLAGVVSRAGRGGRPRTPDR